MSGGYFDYYQFHIRKIADDIEDYIKGNKIDNDDITYYTKEGATKKEIRYMKKYHRFNANILGLSKETISEFKKGIRLLKKAAIYAHRIDWLLSGDDGEDDFHKRLKEDLDNIG